MKEASVEDQRANSTNCHVVELGGKRQSLRLSFIYVNIRSVTKSLAMMCSSCKLCIIMLCSPVLNLTESFHLGTPWLAQAH